MASRNNAGTPSRDNCMGNLIEFNGGVTVDRCPGYLVSGLLGVRVNRCPGYSVSRLFGVQVKLPCVLITIKFFFP